MSLIKLWKKKSFNINAVKKAKKTTKNKAL